MSKCRESKTHLIACGAIAATVLRNVSCVRALSSTVSKSDIAVLHHQLPEGSIRQKVNRRKQRDKASLNIAIPPNRAKVSCVQFP